MRIKFRAIKLKLNSLKHWKETSDKYFKDLSLGMEKTDFEFNWPLVGNKQITRFLSKNIAKKNISGTYIFNGPDNLGKTTVANYFAQILLCQNQGQGQELPCGECPACRNFSIQFGEKNEAENGESENISFRAHGDFHLVKKDKDKKNISVDQVREFIRILGMSSFSNSFKIGIIKNAESLSEEAANALLKTLEEPKENVVIILITQAKDLLPATIVSRAQILNFNLVSSDLIYDFLIEKYKANRSEAKNYSRLALGRPALAVKFLQDQLFREKYDRKVEIFLGFFNQDIAFRLRAIDNLIDKKIQGQELFRLAKRSLEVWQGLIRDMLLLRYNHNNLVQHQQVSEKIFNNFKIVDLLKINRLCQEGEEYLQANVNPKLVLENIAINI